MQFTSKAGKAALALGAVSCLTTGAVAATAAPAAAATAHTFKVCAQGNYTAYGELPQQGGIATVLVAPGKCATLSLASGTTYAKVRGVYNTDPSKSFYVGTAHFTASKGYKGAAKGTTKNPTLVNLG
ncbi:hypothetical protein ABZX30_25145 [Streptomyces sp. NPDC004542]|uniref:hypothetical protein n=1 Tax=Streptomyces sp. NPDC004542 TaxID=3154281 RepID=UPI0033AA9C9A